MKALKLALLALGFALLYYTVSRVGAHNLLEPVRMLGWNLIPLLAVYPLVYFFNTLGWIEAFPKPLPKTIPFWGMYWVRVIGETMNAVIPFTASVGGEPLKAQILKNKYKIPLSEGYGSILIVHTTFWVSLNLFVIGAVCLTMGRVTLTPVLLKSVLAFLVVLSLVGGLFIAGLFWGLFDKFHALGDLFKWWGQDTHDKKTEALSADRDIKNFFTRSPKRFILSSVYNFLAWMMGVFEVWLIGHALGLPIGFFEAWLLEALVQVLRMITFFIPASIGAQEGGIVLIFSQFGFASPVSLTFALIRRLREILWIAVGLLVYSLFTEKNSANL